VGRGRGIAIVAMEAPRPWALALSRRRTSPCPNPSPGATDAREFQRGYIVTFDDRDGRVITSVVVRINQRTATIGIGAADGGTWRVPFHMLRHVLDI